MQKKMRQTLQSELVKVTHTNSFNTFFFHAFPYHYKAKICRSCGERACVALAVQSRISTVDVTSSGKIGSYNCYTYAACDRRRLRAGSSYLIEIITSH
jgi:hypothetical protein